MGETRYYIGVTDSGRTVFEVGGREADLAGIGPTDTIVREGSVCYPVSEEVAEAFMDGVSIVHDITPTEDDDPNDNDSIYDYA